MSSATETTKSCAVALPIERNCATFTKIDATVSATGAQPTGLKALALAVLQRNQQRNFSATDDKKHAQLLGEKNPEKLRGIFESCGHPEPKKKESFLTCYSCLGKDFWLSVHGVKVCRKCHPPADGAEVAG
jgi:hypothetical protein